MFVFLTAGVDSGHSFPPFTPEIVSPSLLPGAWARTKEVESCSFVVWDCATMEPSYIVLFSTPNDALHWIRCAFTAVNPLQQAVSAAYV